MAALIMLAGIYYGAQYGGSISATSATTAVSRAAAPPRHRWHS